MEIVNFKSSTLELIEEYIKNQKIKKMEREGFRGIHIRIGDYDEEKNPRNNNQKQRTTDSKWLSSEKRGRIRTDKNF